MSGRVTVRTNGSTPGIGKQLQVLLAVFDFPLLNLGLRNAIEAEPDMTIVEIVPSREAMPEALARTTADVVITECVPFGRQGCTSFQALEQIRATKPGIKIIALECRCSTDQFSLALKAGADGFLNREAEPSDIVTALRCVARGETYVSPAIVTRMVNTYVLRTPGAIVEDVYDSLSDREKEVLLLAAVGHANREIARQLQVSEQTVHNHRANIMEKLGAHDRVDLLKFAIKRGVIEVADL
jgi:two-component system response regulator NreC